MSDNKLILPNTPVIEPKPLFIPDEKSNLPIQALEHYKSICNIKFNNDFKDKESRKRKELKVRIKVAVSFLLWVVCFSLGFGSFGLFDFLDFLAIQGMLGENNLSLAPWLIAGIFIVSITSYFIFLFSTNDLEALKNESEINEASYRAVSKVMEYRPAVREYVKIKMRESGKLTCIDFQYLRIDDHLLEMVEIESKIKASKQHNEAKNVMNEAKKEVLSKL